MTRTAALVPYREPGKTRLAHRDDLPDGLDTDARRVLARAMLEDVVTALRAGGVGRLLIAAGDPVAARVAADLGVETVPDPRGRDGLSAAVDAASEAIAAEEVLVAAADLPTLDAEDVRTVLDATAAVVVAPTNRGGTGGLLRRPPLIIPACYGPASARRHVDAALHAEVTAETVDLPGFRRDVDTLDDLAALPRGDLGAATAEALDRLGLG